MEKRRYCYAIYFVCLVLIVSLIPAKGASSQDAKSMELSESALGKQETGGKTYRLARPGEDPRMLYLSAGERLFRSQEFREARNAFEKVIELDSRNTQAHYFLGLIEYEEGNVEKAKTRFQIAHECLSEIPEPVLEKREAQLEFPEDYEVRMYYKDGWYILPKGSSVVHKKVHPLEAGSEYRIELKSERGESWSRRIIIGLVLALTFSLAR